MKRVRVPAGGCAATLRNTRRAWLTQAMLAGAGLVAGSSVLAQKAGDEESAISPVETWLFLSDHFDKLKLPATLRYRFNSVGSMSAGEEMELDLALSWRKGQSAATLHTPRGAVELPVEGKLLSNPIMTWFLDRDVATMERLTGGQRRHFQRRLRYALAERQTIDTVSAVQVDKPLPAQQVVLQPYLEDPLKARFVKLAAKRYVFTLSPQVPGRVLRLQTIIPGGNDDFSAPVLTETLSFLGAP